MKLSNPLPNSKLLKYPNGNIWQLYGENPELYKPVGLAFHNGIDLATFGGDGVCAAHYGTVVEIKNTQGGYGYHVRIVSDKLPDGTYIETTYGHLRADIQVKLNDRVVAGQVIGYESNTGYVISGQSAFWGNAPAGKGVHLHFGMRLLTDLAPGNQISYSNGQSFTILNYNNLVYGSINPMPYFNNFMYTLYKDSLAPEEIYAVEGTTKHHITTYPTLVAGGRLRKWNFTSIADIPFTNIEEFSKLTEGQEMVLSPEQIIFTPHD